MFTKFADTPLMSIVLTIDKSFEAHRKAIENLNLQTGKARIEVVLVTSLPEESIAVPALHGFLRVRCIRVAPDTTFAQAKAVGFQQAEAPVVAFTEDHSYPNPEWAEALLSAHQKPWAAVGPAVGNANPVNNFSWADLFILYGRWVDADAAAVVTDLPGQGSSYKRAILMAYGEDLSSMLQMETHLHRDLQLKGYQLYLEPAAKTYHENATKPLAFVREHFHVGVKFARARANSWTALRRLLYSLAAPLIPAVRLKRIINQIKLSGRHQELFPGIWPHLAMGLAVSASGEMLGYMAKPLE